MILDDRAKARAARFYRPLLTYYVPTMAFVSIPLSWLIWWILKRSGSERIDALEQNRLNSGSPAFENRFEQWCFRQALALQLLYSLVGFATCGVGFLLGLWPYFVWNARARAAAESGQIFVMPLVGRLFTPPL